MNFNEDIINAVEALNQGKIILYPTDTIWGLGCDATNEEAIKKIYKIKRREDSKALIVLISRIEQLRDYVVRIPDIAWDIVDFAEKPLTVIYPKGKNVAPNLLAEDGSIAIRLVKNEFCIKLIEKFRKPLVSTSANISGLPSAISFRNIDKEILEKVDYTVLYRREESIQAKPSAIMKIEMSGEVKFLRK